MPAKSISQQQQDAAHLVRSVESTLAIKFPNQTDKKFRSELLAIVTAELETLSPAYIVRLHSAASGVDFTDSDVESFRAACQRSIYRRFRRRAARRSETSES